MAADGPGIGNRKGDGVGVYVFSAAPLYLTFFGPQRCSLVLD